VPGRAVDEPVRVLYSRRVKPGCETDFETWARGIVAAARQFLGHLAASVLNAPGSREYHILFSFADRRSLRAGCIPRSADAGWLG
jgi:hypothetical protein